MVFLPRRFNPKLHGISKFSITLYDVTNGSVIGYLESNTVFLYEYYPHICGWAIIYRDGEFSFAKTEYIERVIDYMNKNIFLNDLCGEHILHGYEYVHSGRDGDVVFALDDKVYRTITLKESQKENGSTNMRWDFVREAGQNCMFTLPHTKVICETTVDWRGNTVLMFKDVISNKIIFDFGTKYCNERTTCYFRDYIDTIDKIMRRENG